ncbi:MAG: cytochrome c [Pseudomonadales bacterium]|nr:cytochrome c [Pseudomonadales bacterium]
MKNTLFFLTATALLCVTQPSIGAEKVDLAKSSHHQHHGMPTEDKRISLNLPPAMKQHQLANMRNHLDAVRRIIEAISTEQFDQASQIASQDLGLTKKMEAMCKRFDNQSFTDMGLAFHKSGDELATVLKGGDMQKSLQALNSTMTYCVSCHATYRQ